MHSRHTRSSLVPPCKHPAAGSLSVVRRQYEAGMNQRVVVIEFDSLQKALAAHDTKEYGAALEALGNGAERDIRIVEGVA